MSAPINNKTILVSKGNLEHSRISKMQIFVKIVNGCKPLNTSKYLNSPDLVCSQTKTYIVNENICLKGQFRFQLFKNCIKLCNHPAVCPIFSVLKMKLFYFRGILTLLVVLKCQTFVSNYTDCCLSARKCHS